MTWKRFGLNPSLVRSDKTLSHPTSPHLDLDLDHGTLARPGTASSQQGGRSSALSLNTDEDHSDLPAFRSAGTLGTPSSSRARMLAQQRELELKKRQSAVQSGGEHATWLTS
eukprot:scaffold1236_cov170-Ochromonas_danica.AAC.2